MDNARLKETMLELFSDMRNELDTLIDSLTEEEKNTRGSMAQWSVKDMLAHLAFWGSHFNEQITKAQAGKAVPMAGDYYEILNDGVLLRNLDKPFETAKAEERSAFEKTDKLLEEIDADDLCDPKYLEFLNNRPLVDRALGTECWHVLTHISDYYVKKGDLHKAEELQVSYTEKLQDFPGWKANAAYNLACFYSLNGMKEKAYQNLESAFQERPELKEWAQKDADMKPICEEAEFKALVK
jgi:hypothetical protein